MSVKVTRQCPGNQDINWKRKRQKKCQFPNLLLLNLFLNLTVQLQSHVTTFLLKVFITPTEHTQIMSNNVYF